MTSGSTTFNTECHFEGASEATSPFRGIAVRISNTGISHDRLQTQKRSRKTQP